MCIQTASVSVAALVMTHNRFLTSRLPVYVNTDVTEPCNTQGNILLSIGAPKGLIIAADLFVVSDTSSAIGLTPVMPAEVPRIM